MKRRQIISCSLAVAAIGVVFVASMGSVAVANLPSCSNCIESGDIASGAVKASELNNDLDDSITANDLASGSVGASEILNGSVGYSDLASTILKGYWTYTTGNVAVDAALGEVEVLATPALPAGNYMLAASVMINNDDVINGAEVSCHLRNASTSANITGADVLGAPDASINAADVASLSLNAAVALPSATAIKLFCDNVISSTDVNVEQASVTALRVKSLTITAVTP